MIYKCIEIEIGLVYSNVKIQSIQLIGNSDKYLFEIMIIMLLFEVFLLYFDKLKYYC